MNRTHVATFANRDGHMLVGILHEPVAQARRDVAIILLSPGVKNRVAPHRLYNKMAAEYASLGFWVLRFDFYGLGDAEGEVGERLLADLYRSIQLGRYVDDTRCAMDWMQHTYGIPKFVLGGLCGGAITGLLAGAKDHDVVGLLGLGVPVILDGSNVDKVRNLTVGQIGGLRAKYLRKLFSPEAWLRLLTFRSDLRQLTRVLSAPLRALRSRPAAPQATVGSPPAPAASNLNPLFPPACLDMLASGRPMFLLFSGADRLYFEFREKFLATYQADVDTCSGPLEVSVVDQANHIFTFTAWQDDMLARSRHWLLARFPAAAP